MVLLSTSFPVTVIDGCLYLVICPFIHLSACLMVFIQLFLNLSRTAAFPPLFLFFSSRNPRQMVCESHLSLSASYRRSIYQDILPFFSVGHDSCLSLPLHSSHFTTINIQMYTHHSIPLPPLSNRADLFLRRVVMLLESLLFFSKKFILVPVKIYIFLFCSLRSALLQFPLLEFP